VTWPEPELEEGADPEERPPELPELELPELDEPEPDELWPEPEVCEVPECAAADWALAPAGRTTATAPPARTLAAPMAAVTARSRPRFRSRASTAARTDVST
jgi:hypothetical protein